MENQHRKISGYRELNQSEIDLMNEIKALGPVVEGVIIKVQEHIKSQRDRVAEDRSMNLINAVHEHERLELATPERFAALAKTDFQTALMYLTRSVAQPTFF